MTLKLDAKNARKHSDRNKQSIRKSLEVAKPARSIVLDSGDNILAGNGVYEQADAMGIPVQIVETRGDVLVAVKRMDVAPESPEARQIATLDNLVADTSYADYDADLLREALANDPVSKAIAEQDERLRKLLGNTGKQETGGISFDGNRGLQYRVIIDCVSETQQRDLLERFESEGLTCRALMS